VTAAEADRQAQIEDLRDRIIRLAGEVAEAAISNRPRTGFLGAALVLYAQDLADLMQSGDNSPAPNGAPGDDDAEIMGNPNRCGTCRSCRSACQCPQFRQDLADSGPVAQVISLDERRRAAM
jgi:hypothetical protein